MAGGSGGGRRRRDLRADERALWDQVAKSIAPLELGRTAEAPESGIDLAPAVAPIGAGPLATEADHDAPLVAGPPHGHEPGKRHRTSPPAAMPRPKPTLKPLAPFDDRTRRRLARGREPVEARLDLHGLTQHDALITLRGFIADACRRELKMVLVITGKGRSGSPGPLFDPNDRGVLRRVVPQWLAMPDMRDQVVGFEEAHLTHGGAGALYVRLRRTRVLTVPALGASSSMAKPTALKEAGPAGRPAKRPRSSSAGENPLDHWAEAIGVRPLPDSDDAAGTVVVAPNAAPAASGAEQKGQPSAGRRRRRGELLGDAARLVGSGAEALRAAFRAALDAHAGSMDDATAGRADETVPEHSGAAGVDDADQELGARRGEAAKKSRRDRRRDGTVGGADR